MLTTVAQYLRSRRRQVAWATGLALGSVGLLVAGPFTEGYPHEVMVNFAASLAMVALSFIIFDPVFDDLRRNAVEEHEALNRDRFIASITTATDTIEVMDTWSGLLEDAYRERFLAAVRGAVERGVQVRMLFLDPESSAAEQRTEEVSQDVPELIQRDLQHLRRLQISLPAEQAARLAVRIYDASPAIQLYRWDEKGFISFFPVDRFAYDGPQLEMFMASALGQFVCSRFDELWAGRATRTLEDFARLNLTVWLGPRRLGAATADYVRAGSDAFVDGNALVHHLTDHGAAALRVLVVGAGLAADGPPFGLHRVDRSDQPLHTDVGRRFDAKYGPARQRIVLQLVPSTGDA